MNDIVPPPDTFQNLDIPRKGIAPSTSAQYRIYSSAKEFVMVEAENAQAAILTSGVKNPVRAVRHMPMQCNVLEFPVSDTPEAVVQSAPASADVSAEIVALADNAPQNAAEDATPLSNDDIDKLLGSA